MGKVRGVINGEDTPQIVALWEKGLGSSAIALKLGLGQSAVRKWLIEHGLTRTREDAIKAHINAMGSFNLKKEPANV